MSNPGRPRGSGRPILGATPYGPGPRREPGAEDVEPYYVYGVPFREVHYGVPTASSQNRPSASAAMVMAGMASSTEHGQGSMAAASLSTSTTTTASTPLRQPTPAQLALEGLRSYAPLGPPMNPFAAGNLQPTMNPFAAGTLQPTTSGSGASASSSQRNPFAELRQPTATGSGTPARMVPSRSSYTPEVGRSGSAPTRTARRLHYGNLATTAADVAASGGRADVAVAGLAAGLSNTSITADPSSPEEESSLPKEAPMIRVYDFPPHVRVPTRLWEEIYAIIRDSHPAPVDIRVLGWVYTERYGKPLSNSNILRMCNVPDLRSLMQSIPYVIVRQTADGNTLVNASTIRQRHRTDPLPTPSRRPGGRVGNTVWLDEAMNQWETFDIPPQPFDPNQVWNAIIDRGTRIQIYDLLVNWYRDGIDIAMFAEWFNIRYGSPIDAPNRFGMSLEQLLVSLTDILTVSYEGNRLWIRPIPYDELKATPSFQRAMAAMAESKCGETTATAAAPSAMEQQRRSDRAEASGGVRASDLPPIDERDLGAVASSSTLSGAQYGSGPLSTNAQTWADYDRRKSAMAAESSSQPPGTASASGSTAQSMTAAAAVQSKYGGFIPPDLEREWEEDAGPPSLSGRPLIDALRTEIVFILGQQHPEGIAVRTLAWFYEFYYPSRGITHRDWRMFLVFLEAMDDVTELYQREHNGKSFDFVRLRRNEQAGTSKKFGGRGK